jgi:hypothetical protein
MNFGRMRLLSHRQHLLCIQPGMEGRLMIRPTE